MAKLGPGARIGDQFLLIRKIGEGGCGEVYLAEQTSLGRNAVVKLMHPELSRDPSYVARFRREAQLAAKLSHHHVASIYAFGETPERVLWIAMEYIEGESLHTALARETPRALAELLAPVADVLDRAGSMGIIHRDVKPDNIIVSPDGVERRAVLLDFGLARPMEDNDKLTQAGVAVGSPTYMSPEQVFGPSVDAATDRYAFGIILYISVAKRPPFKHEDRVQLVLMHKRQPVPSLHSVAPSLPENHPLDKFFTKALAKQPQDRYPSARQMIVEFIQALEGSPVARGDGAGGQPPSHLGRTPSPGPMSSIGQRVTAPFQAISGPPSSAGTPSGRPPPPPGSTPAPQPVPAPAPQQGQGQRPEAPSRPTRPTTLRDIAAGWDTPGNPLGPGTAASKKTDEPVVSPRTLEARANRTESPSASLRSTMPQISAPPVLRKVQAQVKGMIGDIAKVEQDAVPAPMPAAPTQQNTQPNPERAPEHGTKEVQSTAQPKAEPAPDPVVVQQEKLEEPALSGHRRLLCYATNGQEDHGALDVLCATEVLLGKHRDCDVVCRAFPSPEQDAITHGVSRQHARLRVASGKLYLEDLGSLNGTYLDGRRLSAGPVMLSDEARIRLGPVLTIEVRLFKGGAALLRRVDPYGGNNPSTLMIWDRVPLGEASLGLVPPTGDSVTRWGTLQYARPNGDLFWNGPPGITWHRGQKKVTSTQALQLGDLLSAGELQIEWVLGDKPGV